MFIGNIKSARPQDFANPCPWCNSRNLLLEGDRWDPEIVVNVVCECGVHGPLLGGTPAKEISDIEWNLVVDRIDNSAWLAWNIRGGPPERLSDEKRFGEAEEKKQATTPQPLANAQPCPFCFSLKLEVEDYGFWVVICGNCLAHGPEGPDETNGLPTEADIQRAVERWNARTK